MSNNLACVGWFVAHQAELGQLVTRALRLPSARQLGERDGVAVWRADDPSGARVVVGVQGGQIIDFLPTFAGRGHGLPHRHAAALTQMGLPVPHRSALSRPRGASLPRPDPPPHQLAVDI